MFSFGMFSLVGPLVVLSGRIMESCSMVVVNLKWLKRMRFARYCVATAEKGL